jgi:hypothetical protein
MTKKYKRKEYIEKNSSDKEKLDKVTKRSFEKTNRSLSKKEIKEDLEQLSIDKDGKDLYYENEMALANLCYTVSHLDSEHKCTCPNPENDALAKKHIDFLNNRIVELMRLRNEND